MPRCRQLRRAITGCVLILIAGSLLGCSSTVPGVDGGGLRIANKSAVPSHEQAELSSGLSEGTRVRPELASAAEPKAISAKNGSKTKHHSSQPRGTQDRSPASKDEARADSDTAPGATSSAMTTPAVGSPEWKRQKQETEQQEQRIKRLIEGVCRGC
jgi:hypothetical protein